MAVVLAAANGAADGAERHDHTRLTDNITLSSQQSNILSVCHSVPVDCKHIISSHTIKPTLGCFGITDAHLKMNAGGNIVWSLRADEQEHRSSSSSCKWCEERESVIPTAGTLMCFLLSVVSFKVLPGILRKHCCILPGRNTGKGQTNRCPQC